VSDDIRPDPDTLLAAIQKEERKEKRGKLKVFLGMAAGVGKTYAMLEAAIRRKKEGEDILIGYIETHGRKDTDALAQQLSQLPRQKIRYREIDIEEFDLDAALARHPQIILVDELAHTNVPGSRHPKRYQDILELLDAGINVYTTLNVQHVESRSQTVYEITGSTMHETVPDSVLDSAEIELIDISPEDLLKRLDEGKVYIPERAAVAMMNFFREGNLTALREIALRLAAERVGQDVREYMKAMQIEGPWKTGHRLLVAVSPSPLSSKMIRWTRRLADSLDAPWIAVHIEGPRALTDEQQERLTKNLALARELGAEVITAAETDVIRGLLRIARQHNVTQIVVGKPARGAFLRRSFLRRLVEQSGDIDVHVVRAEKSEAARTEPQFFVPRRIDWPQYGMALAVVVAVSLLNFLLDRFIGYRALALNFLFAVVLLALFVGRGPVLMAATASAVIWNYFFLPPRYTFFIRSFEDAMMFAMYFVVAVVLGQLIARLRDREQAERRREERATALYLLTRDLAEATHLDDILDKLVRQLSDVFNADIAALLGDEQKQLGAQPHFTSTLALSDKEFSVATWVFNHGRAAGRFTENLPSSEAIYLPLATAKSVLGVLGIRLKRSSPPTLEQRNLLDAFVRQAALVIDRARLREQAERSRVAAESQRLGKTLLDSISHEMRTPISAILSAAGQVRERTSGNVAGAEATAVLLQEIETAAQRLDRLVANLLDITRIESGHLKPRLDWHDLREIVAVALGSLGDELANHTMEVRLPPQLPLVRADFILMEQALVNILHNAAIYTPPKTRIAILGAFDDTEVTLSVADEGPGLPPDLVDRVFDKFTRGPNAPAGGTGLGLSIVKGFVEAQNGSVRAENRDGGGALFTISLPRLPQPQVPAEK
jgi:two-component system sensor histidine kinase KdpD